VPATRTRATGTPAGGPAAAATTGGRGSSQRRVLVLSLKRCVTGARTPGWKLSKSSTCVVDVRLPEQHGNDGSSARRPSSVAGLPVTKVYGVSALTSSRRGSTLLASTTSASQRNRTTELKVTFGSV